MINVTMTINCSLASLSMLGVPCYAPILQLFFYCSSLFCSFGEVCPRSRYSNTVGLSHIFYRLSFRTVKIYYTTETNIK